MSPETMEVEDKTALKEVMMHLLKAEIMTSLE